MKTASLLLAMLCLGLSSVVVAQDVTHGKALFDAKCRSCHRSAVNFRMPSAELPGLLLSKSVRSHRFQLTDAEVQDITAYLVKVKVSK